MWIVYQLDQGERDMTSATLSRVIGPFNSKEEAEKFNQMSTLRSNDWWDGVMELEKPYG
jgi:hypothetical protein